MSLRASLTTTASTRLDMRRPAPRGARPLEIKGAWHAATDDGTWWQRQLMAEVVAKRRHGDAGSTRRIDSLFFVEGLFQCSRARGSGPSTWRAVGRSVGVGFGSGCRRRAGVQGSCRPHWSSRVVPCFPSTLRTAAHPGDRPQWRGDPDRAPRWSLERGAARQGDGRDEVLATRTQPPENARWLMRYVPYEQAFATMQSRIDDVDEARRDLRSAYRGAPDVLFEPEAQHVRRRGHRRVDEFPAARLTRYGHAPRPSGASMRWWPRMPPPSAGGVRAPRRH